MKRWWYTRLRRHYWRKAKRARRKGNLERWERYRGYAIGLQRWLCTKAIEKAYREKT
jgi:hypothetical protein